MKPAVAFILPVFNGLPYVNEAVQSILRQTCPDWRLYLVDDLSTDGSRGILDQFCDPRITKIYSAANSGLYGLLSKTIAALTEDWISILHQDDRLRPDYLESMLRLIEQYPDADAFATSADFIGPDGSLQSRGEDTGRTWRWTPGIAAWEDVLNRGCIWSISGSFTSRRLLSSFPFRTDLPHCGDYEWLLRAARSFQLVTYVRPLIELRVHKGQASFSNLRRGTDVKEGYEILKHELSVHYQDLRASAVVRVCLRRSRLIGRKLLGAIARGRLRHAGWLGYYALLFFKLPFELKRQGRCA
jgi:glycosyltransferase involved in cell wall biosynthesis